MTPVAIGQPALRAVPLTIADRDAVYWWELSMAQIETSRTIVFTQPRYARAFTDALRPHPNLPPPCAPSNDISTTGSLKCACPQRHENTAQLPKSASARA
jgi:hypothetical protein